MAGSRAGKCRGDRPCRDGARSLGGTGWEFGSGLPPAIRRGELSTIAGIRAYRTVRIYSETSSGTGADIGYHVR